MKRKRKNRIIYSVVIILTGLIISFLTTDKLARQIIISNIESSTTNTFINVSNKAMQTVLNNTVIDYNELALIEKNEENNVIAVKCDTVKLMKIKTILDDEIYKVVDKEPFIKFSVPIGTFIGNEYLVGRGPAIHFKFRYDCATKAEFKSEFSSAGINQTIHRIVLYLSTDISTVIPWYHASTTVDTSYIIAETIIVGEAPTSYSNINLDTLNKLLNGKE